MHVFVNKKTEVYFLFASVLLYNNDSIFGIEMQMFSNVTRAYSVLFSYTHMPQVRSLLLGK